MPTQLSIPIECGGRLTYGYCTPEEDKVAQKMLVPPPRVIPVVFIPGIMGSNLRLSAQRQAELKKANNIAWRPDHASELGNFTFSSAAERQLQLDPRQTVVDTYDGGSSPTGSEKTSLARHAVGEVNVYFAYRARSPLLTNDPPTANPSYSKAEKVRRRGWTEVFLSSYLPLLENCEKFLNSPIKARRWQTIVGKDPAEWGAVPSYGMTALTEAEHTAAMKGCFFPIHAMGYNWLQDNEQSAKKLSSRILALIAEYQNARFQCERVILLTHSMGGLIARAIVHPDIGGLANQVLGIVHGVMPALGSPAAYKRMRSGFEQDTLQSFVASFPLGHTGERVTAVLGNSAGGLQLLPSCGYGNGWLQLRQNGLLFDTFPKHGDPYTEIYKASNRWYGLLKEEWLNPAKDARAGLQRTHALLDVAKRFHERISQTYHAQTYAHYGADSGRPSWESITWNVTGQFNTHELNCLQIAEDDGQGKLSLQCTANDAKAMKAAAPTKLGPSTGAGDQTVPIRSSDHQLFHKGLCGVFRQIGYEHQASFCHQMVVDATLYSIVRIAQTMVWKK